ncbi:MAG TPA: N-acetylglutaminylglutamine amidotransferase [Betaproteobacteria bacterium]|nr:N-acetylglutaminylglutamine amidotransferase [Betaproteobacteria bacterium]
MCGICGELRFDGAQPELPAIGKMLARLARRGPDHEGSYSDGPVAFGHRRLAIIDLSESANQPMVDNALRLALVFNGTIYNYRALRTELAHLGYRFFSDGDSEVILKAYHAWGERCVERFNGMFAFAIWDARRHELFLARDRFGIKPLYYALDAQRLRFASSPQALLAAGGVDTALDPVGLHYHLTLHAVVPAPRTILRGVRKLAPAATLTLTPRGERREQVYWTLTAQRPGQPVSETEWLAATEAALTAAVERRRLASDVPVGVLLSGGLDSSLLVGLLDRIGVDNLLTFSVGFEDVGGERANEFEYSDQVVEKFHTRHHKYLIPNREILKRLPEAVASMAEPMVGQDAVAFYLLAEKVSREVKVVLSGQGADEVFAGYFWFPLMEAAQGGDVERFRRYYCDRSHEEFLRTVAPAYHGEDETARWLAARFADAGADTFLDKVLRLDVTTLIVDDPVKRVDNMTMAWGLEARVPFLDHELVEQMAQMPPPLKLRENGKYPLKAIARGLAPDAVIDRPKGYFPVPALKYVRGDFLAFMTEILHSRACRQRGLFQRDTVNRLLAAPEAYFTPLQGSKLWHLALLEYWLQLNVDSV